MLTRSSLETDHTKKKNVFILNFIFNSNFKPEKKKKKTNKRTSVVSVSTYVLFFVY